MSINTAASPEDADLSTLLAQLFAGDEVTRKSLVPAFWPHLSTLLSGFLNGDETARDALPLILQDRLKGWVWLIARDLYEMSLAEDVVQRMWLLLLGRKPGSFKAPYAVRYLWFLMRTAARDIRSAFAAPGQRTRRRFEELPEAGGLPVATRLPKATLLRGDWPADHSSLEDIVADKTEDTEAEACSQVEVQYLLGLAHIHARPGVGYAMRLVCDNDLSFVDASAMAGISRDVFNRGVKAVGRAYAAHAGM